MPPNPIDQYLSALREKYKDGDATERSYYSALENLLEASSPRIKAVSEPKRSDCGAPDFHIKKGDLILGHIEAKDLGASLDDAEKSEQIKERYLKALPNLILTNFLEFRWYVNGEHRNTMRLGEVADHRKLKTTKDGTAELADLLKSFLAQKPRRAANAKDLAVRLAYLAHEIRTVVVNGFARDLVSDNVKDLRDAVKRELIPDLTDERFADLFSQTLAYGFFAAWCNHPTGKPFRRLGAAGEIPKTNPLLRDIFELMTGNALDKEPFVGYVDDLVQLLDCTERADIMADFARKTGRADPVVHFYETFLKEYDPKVRELRGVYYTPAPVVSYMVRSVDHLLKIRFGLPKGLADTAQTEYEVEGEKSEKLTKTGPRVLILDPACGTGTFLFEIVNHIRDEFIRRRQSGAWSSYVREHLLPRLFGFELLMAPYAMAHLKLGLQLAGQDLDAPARSSYAYDFSGDERLGVYLTNTLEEAARRAETLFGPYRILTEEANAAAEIKRDKPIMVVIGNPPYSGHSANRSWEKKNGKRVPTFIGKLLQDYYEVDDHPLGERNPKWLQDDYVKFIRFGQWRIEESRGGILALITNHSYLDNPTFRGMRQHLMQAFTDIYILDLHGNSRKKEVCPDGSKDENVFDIQQGVAIAIFLKDPNADSPARVWHADMWGLRKAKEAYLAEQIRETITWTLLSPSSPMYLFVPQAGALASEYEEYPKVADVMLLHGVGMTTARDAMVIDFEQPEIIRRVETFRDSTASDAELCHDLGIPRKKGWNITKARHDLAQEENLSRFVKPVLHRPFDTRLIFYHDSLVWRTCKQTMRHMLAASNLALITTRQTKDPFDALVTRLIARHKCLAVYDINTLFPLYLYGNQMPGKREMRPISRAQMLHEAQQRLAEAGGDAAAQKGLADTIRRLFPDPEYPRWPNLDPLLLADLEDRLGLRFVFGGAGSQPGRTGSQPVNEPSPSGRGDLKKTFGPEDVFNYIYAILHSPTYRQRYAEFLKRDFPRIPFTSDRKLFAKLAQKGAELVALHLLESDDLAEAAQPLSGDGDNRVERVRYDAKDHRVYINKTQHFPDVPSDVWSFKVGGYQVCDKWLKDRKGRPLSYDDQEHYTKVTVALRETIRLMREIDEAIPSWPIT